MNENLIKGFFIQSSLFCSESFGKHKVCLTFLIAFWMKKVYFKIARFCSSFECFNQKINVTNKQFKLTESNKFFKYQLIGRPEPNVTWYNGAQAVQTNGAVSTSRHITVNRLEINHVKRDALNSTYVCQASNTKLVPPAERAVRVEMLCEFWLNY